MAGVSRRLRQASHSGYKIAGLKILRFVDSETLDHPSESGTACHHWHAPLGEKASLCNEALRKPKRQFQDISAGGVFQFRTRIGAIQLSGISRMLEVVENFWGVHHDDCNLSASPAGTNDGCAVTSSIPQTCKIGL